MLVIINYYTCMPEALSLEHQNAYFDCRLITFRNYFSLQRFVRNSHRS